MQQRLLEAQKELSSAQKHFQAVSTGFTGCGDGQMDTLATQKIGREYIGLLVYGYRSV